MVKRVLSLFLAIVLLLLFAGCGAKEPTQQIMGTWVTESPFGEISYLFNEDGSFNKTIGASSSTEQSGTYTVEKDILTLTLTTISMTSTTNYKMEFNENGTQLTIYEMNREGNASTTGQILQKWEKEEDPSETTIPTSASTSIYDEVYWNAVESFLGNPMESGWATDKSYLQRMAYDEKYIYWFYSYGGMSDYTIQDRWEPTTFYSFKDDFSDCWKILLKIYLQNGTLELGKIDLLGQETIYNTINFSYYDTETGTEITPATLNGISYSMECYGTIEKYWIDTYTHVENLDNLVLIFQTGTYEIF